MILGILGSASKDSTSRAAMTAVQDRLNRAHRHFDLVDLAVEYRELHDLEQYGNPDADGQTAQLRQRVAAADAVVLATPVYHGSFSALLKNFLDHLLSDAFQGKPVALIANGGGPRSGGIACEQLRSVVRSLSGWSTPTHMAISPGDFEGGAPSPFIASRLDLLVGELCEFPALHRVA